MFATLLGLITGPLGRLLAFLGAYLAGSRAGAQKAENKALKEYQKERQAIDEADVSKGDADADRAWLRDASKRLSKRK